MPGIKRTKDADVVREDMIIEEAISIIGRRLKRRDILFHSPNLVKQYLICNFGTSEREIFSVLWMDVRNRLIDHEILFYGTLTHCAIYPREVVRSGMRLNAAGCILVHNHPSGSPEPSEADRRLTRTLVQALDFVDIRVADHIIVAGTLTHSFAEHGQV